MAGSRRSQVSSTAANLLILVGVLGVINCRPQESSFSNDTTSSTTTSNPVLSSVSIITATTESSNDTAPTELLINQSSPTSTSDLTESENTTPTSSDDLSIVELSAEAFIPNVTSSTIDVEPTSNVPTNTSESSVRAASAPRAIYTATAKDISEAVGSASNRSTVAPEEEKWEFDGPIRRCNHGNSIALNKCLRLIVQDLRPKFKSGIPELSLPPMDPLHLRSVSFQHGSGPIKVIATFKNVDATGLGNLSKTEFEVDMKRRILEFDLEIPQLQIIGEYELSGNLFFFPIGGKGNFWVHLDQISAKGQGKLGLTTMNNRKTVQMSKIDLELDINNVKLHLTNLFNGDPVLGNVINNFLNENSKDIFDEIRPQITKQVGDMVQFVSNRALGLLGADHFADVHNSELDTA